MAFRISGFGAGAQEKKEIIPTYELGETEHNLTQEGLYYRVKPFMERNGYRDGAGWWVKLEEKLR